MTWFLMNRVIVGGEALLALIPDMHEVKSLRRSSRSYQHRQLCLTFDRVSSLRRYNAPRLTESYSFVLLLVRSLARSLARPRVPSFFLSTYRRTTIEFYERILCIGSDGIYDSI